LIGRSQARRAERAAVVEEVRATPSLKIQVPRDATLMLIVIWLWINTY
jgi:hypothetical protein